MYTQRSDPSRGYSENPSDISHIRDIPEQTKLSRSALSSAVDQNLMSVCVVLPAHNAAQEIGQNLETLMPLTVPQPDEPIAPVSRILVVDDRSNDATSQIALDSGAAVLKTQDARDVFPEYFVGSFGKGAAMAVGALAALAEAQHRGYATSRTVLVYLDANLHPKQCMSIDHVLALASPIVRTVNSAVRSISFVQSRSQRVLNGVVGAGGRVKQQYVRPLVNEIAKNFPELQAISSVEGVTDGEVAIRGDLARELSWGLGYSVELRNLLQAIGNVGPARVAQAWCPPRSKLNHRPSARQDSNSDKVRGTVESQGEGIVRTLRTDLGLPLDAPLVSIADGVTHVVHVPVDGTVDLTGPPIETLHNLPRRTRELRQLISTAQSPRAPFVSFSFPRAITADLDDVVGI